MKFYAQAICYVGYSLKSLTDDYHDASEIYVFDSEKERDDFVEKYKTYDKKLEWGTSHLSESEKEEYLAEWEDIKPSLCARAVTKEEGRAHLQHNAENLNGRFYTTQDYYVEDPVKILHYDEFYYEHFDDRRIIMNFKFDPKKRKFYAEGKDHGYIGLESFANVSGEPYVFDSKKERDEFVEKYKWYRQIVCARKITSKRALQLAGYRRSKNEYFDGFTLFPEKFFDKEKVWSLSFD